MIQFEKDYPGVTTNENVDNIIDGFENTVESNKSSLLSRLREQQEIIKKREQNLDQDESKIQRKQDETSL